MSSYVPGVPDKTGSFFYLELDKGLPSDDLDVDEYQYMYHAEVIVGSNRSRTELQVSTMERQIAFYNKDKCENCDLNNDGFNQEYSSTSVTLHNLFEYKEKASVYSQSEDGRYIQSIEFTGEQESDSVRFIDPTTTKNGSDNV